MCITYQPPLVEVEPGAEVGEDKKILYTLHSVVESVTADMMDIKSTGNDGVPADLVKLFREDSLSRVTQHINKANETGEWPKNCNDVDSDYL